MNAATLAALSHLGDLRSAALESVQSKHKYPALLLLYSFIDVCAAVCDDGQPKDNRGRFEAFLLKHASLTTWQSFTTYDLWAARSSLLHSFSPLGNHTKPGKSARPIFYFAWPETKDEVNEALRQRGYSGYLLLDIETIKWLAVDCFNTMWRRVDNEPAFEQLIATNSRDLLRNLFQMKFEAELLLLEKLASEPR
jgi:hypothetical protein